MSDDIDKLVKATIETKIIEAFRSTPEMIDELVRAALNQEVNDYGGKPDYHERSKMPFLTYLARKAIQQVAQETVEQHITEMSPVIEQAVKDRLSATDVVDAFTKQILAHSTENWRIKVSFEPERE